MASVNQELKLFVIQKLKQMFLKSLKPIYLAIHNVLFQTTGNKTAKNTHLSVYFVVLDLFASVSIIRIISSTLKVLFLCIF